MKSLGITVNNRGTELENVFEETIEKVRKLALKWSRFTLSLPGRIAISKTMLVSQVGYVGCIIMPKADQLARLQSIIDGYATTGIIIARDRLYTKPKSGGLGLINLEKYCTALQCSWLKRCLTNINDVWRWNLAKSCNFNLDMVRADNICSNEFPVLHGIAKSVQELQQCHWKMHENFKAAPLVDNMFFLRSEPTRRNPARGCVDQNLLGAGFYQTNRNELLSLRLNCMLTGNGNGIVTVERLRQVTGLNFTENVHMYLSTAARFALKKYGGKEGSNGTCLTLTAIMERCKKGSNRYRKLLEKKDNNGTSLEKLRVVTTMFRLGNCEIPGLPDLGLLYGLWNLSYLTIRIRTFAFQFFNNSVSVANRTAARYGNAGMDQRCIFCVKGNRVNPDREDFCHLFITCPILETVMSQYFMRNFNVRYDTGNANLRCFKLTGLWGMMPAQKKFFTVLNVLLLNYVVWQFRLKKIIPGLATLELEIDTLFSGVMNVSKKWSEIAINSDASICRRWREQQHRRG
jgi:hypothetical protein